jgi:hypothetical protein
LWSFGERKLCGYFLSLEQTRNRRERVRRKFGYPAHCFYWWLVKFFGEKWRGQSSSFQQMQTLFFNNLKGFLIISEIFKKKWFDWSRAMEIWKYCSENKLNFSTKQILNLQWK